MEEYFDTTEIPNIHNIRNRGPIVSCQRHFRIDARSKIILYAF